MVDTVEHLRILLKSSSLILNAGESRATGCNPQNAEQHRCKETSDGEVIPDSEEESLL